MKPATSAIDIEFGGERLTLLAQKAVLWPREKTLFVADVHLGKAASFRAAGLAVPSGHSRDDVARLSRLVEMHTVSHLVVLGDLVHNKASYTAALDETMRSFTTTHPTLKKTLVIGNHDSSAGDCPLQWGFTLIHDDWQLGPYLCKHAPEHRASNMQAALHSLAGHLHPAAWVRTTREALNLPCFWLRERELVLPSFGSLTGRFVVQPAPSDVTFVVTGQQIFRNPSTSL
jgi:uncharacterized protein